MRLPSLLVIVVQLAACAGPRALERPASTSTALEPPAPAISQTTAAVATSEAPPADTPAAEASADAVFAATVRPILASRCTPCHEKGGRMYERLPFDDGSVVASHAESVVRRLKEPKEKEAVEAWLARRAPR
jgi:hypothetical protein